MRMESFRFIKNLHLGDTINFLNAIYNLAVQEGFIANIITKSKLISELLNMIVSEKRETISDDMWSKTYWQVNHGSITCLDYTENGEWHVQAMNYTGHLDMYTGIKSPFV